MQGALLGIALGVLLVLYEYITVKKEVEERAAARHKKPQFEPTDRARITSVLRFALLLPFGAAGIFWLWSGMT